MLRAVGVIRGGHANLGFPPMPSVVGYDILAVDLDGTLLNPSGKVSPANALAVRKAREAGIEVVVCTGRSLAECKHILAELNLTGAAVVAGGAMTVEAATGRTMRRSVMDPTLVADVAAMLNRATGHYVLLLKDFWTTRIDYLLVGEGKCDPATEWWFSVVPVAVQRVEHLDGDPFPDETVRLGVVTGAREMKHLGAQVVERFGTRVFVHHFPVLSAAGDNGRHRGDDAVHLLELFNIDTNKWSAVAALADARGVPHERVAAIGDEVNDVALLRHAGLGIAMGNALDSIKQIASRETLTNAEDGVAHAIEHILRAEW